MPHLVLELVEEDLGDEVVVLPGHAVGVGGVDAEHLGRDPEEAAAVHSLVVLLRHERGAHRLVLRLPRQRRDDSAHPVVDDRLRAEDRPEDALHGLLLAARQPPEALGVGGEIDAVGVPGVDVRRRQDVREGPPAAGDLPVGGLVVGDQRFDLVQEPPDLRARRAYRHVLGGQVGGYVHVATLRRWVEDPPRRRVLRWPSYECFQVTEKAPLLMELGWALTVEPDFIVIGSMCGVLLVSSAPFALAPEKLAVPKFASGRTPPLLDGASAMTSADASLADFSLAVVVLVQPWELSEIVSVN